MTLESFCDYRDLAILFAMREELLIGFSSTELSHFKDQLHGLFQCLSREESSVQKQRFLHLLGHTFSFPIQSQLSLLRTPY